MKKVPQIRFKEFRGDWEQRKLEDFLEVSSEKNFNGTFTRNDVLSVSGELGIVNQIEFQGRSFAGISVLNYGVVGTGNVVYTKSPLKTNPYGIIKVNRGKPGIVSTLYAVYHGKPNVFPDFIQCYFEQDARVNNYLHPLVNKGAKNDMKVSAKNALKGSVNFPKYEEQMVIARFFSVLDRFITLYYHKCEEIKKFKKFMLQKMFPQSGANVPEVRFHGFTGDWEQCKYGDVIDLLSGQDFETSQYNEVGEGIPYMTGASCIVNGSTVASRWTLVPRCIAYQGEVLLVCKGSGYGTLARLAQERAHIARQFMDLRCTDALNNTFNYYLAFSVVKEIKKNARGLIAGIDRSAILKQAVSIPKLAEQEKIGSFFQHLDHLITLHQHELESYKKMKQYMLQNMFV